MAKRKLEERAIETEEEITSYLDLLPLEVKARTAHCLEWATDRMLTEAYLAIEKNRGRLEDARKHFFELKTLARDLAGVTGRLPARTRTHNESNLYCHLADARKEFEVCIEEARVTSLEIEQRWEEAQREYSRLWNILCPHTQFYGPAVETFLCIVFNIDRELLYGSVGY